MKPAYEKAAKALDGLAQVAAVNCDEAENQAFCSSMGVKGFPTLKTFRPTSTKGKPTVADYNGDRSAKGITEAVKDLIPNHVKRVADKDLESWLAKDNDTAKAILFSDKGTTSALMKALSAEFYGRLHLAQVREKEAGAVSTFGITKFPTLVVLPGGTADAVVYDGELAKAPMTAFLGKYAAVSAATSPTKEAKTSSQTSTESAADGTESATTIVLDTANPTESPDPFVADDTQQPIVVMDPPPTLPTLESAVALQSACLGPRTHTCILAVLPAPADPEATLPDSAATALASLSELDQKHKTRGSKLFPFFAIPAANPGVKALQSGLGLKDGDVEIVAVNGRRSWWRHFAADKGFGVMELEDWIDGIRLGEGKKEKLPEGLVVELKPAEEPISEATAEVTEGKEESEKPNESEEKADGATDEAADAHQASTEEPGKAEESGKGEDPATAEIKHEDL